jgi:hypothetical protein
MVQDIGFVAARVLQGVREDRHAVEFRLIIDGSGQGGHVRREPAGRHGDGTERVAEDFPEYGGLHGRLDGLGRRQMPTAGALGADAGYRFRDVA